MCGINGLYGLEDIDNPSALIAKMNAALAHRGPDAEGITANDHIALGHKRLSIIDLDASSNQPIQDSTGRFTMVFNGEIYNFKEVKSKLTSYSFRTQGDSEVVLAAYMTWGPACLQELNGMFALAIWDNEKQELFLARDRMGIKPLYTAWVGNTLIFSSEIKALLAAGLKAPKLDTERLSEYLMYQTVHEPNTILEGVSMLPSAHYSIINEGGEKLVRYWAPSQGLNQAKGLDEKQTRARIKELLHASVERRMISDVPFGAFLSGGIDSSAMVGLMSGMSDTAISTFSVSFDEGEFSEAKYARLVAERFNTNHQEIRLKPDDFLETLPEALNAMDHPSGDGPNTYVVSKVTKQAGITVAISGLGGDELFAGYGLFEHGHRAMSNPWISQHPMFLRKLLAGAYSKFKPGIAGQKAAKLLTRHRMELAHVYPILRQTLMDRQIGELLLNPKDAESNMGAELQSEKELWVGLPRLGQISFAEMSTYLRSVLLRDTDQMSMLHALEVRVPFLDHQLVEFVMGVSDELKYPSTPKRLLTESLADLLPREIIDRPKMGFTLPWQHWMKHEMRAYCQSRIEGLAQRAPFHSRGVLGLWEQFLKDDPMVSWSRVWPLIVLENWLQTHNVEA